MPKTTTKSKGHSVAFRAVVASLSVVVILIAFLGYAASKNATERFDAEQERSKSLNQKLVRVQR